jgi:hypothetical protein
LSKLKEALVKIYDEPKVSVVPYFLDLSPEEFAEFKEPHKSIWEPDYLESKSQFLKTREEIMTILSKKIEDENYSRTNFLRFFEERLRLGQFIRIYR